MRATTQHIRLALSTLTVVAAAGLAPLPTAIPGMTTVAEAQSSMSRDPAVAVKRENLTKLASTTINLDFEDQRLEDVLNFLADITGAELEPIYIDDRNAEGLDPETLISLRVNNQSALQVLERVLRLAERGQFVEFAWQMSPWGSVEIGPKPVLNRAPRIEIYDIADLLFEIEDFDEFAEIDLQQVLQQNQGGGGGGQSPFEQNQNDNDDDNLLRIDRANEVIALITTQIETVQWDEFGVEIQYYDPIRALMVSAPDYMQRQLVGYPWYPSELQIVAQGNTRFLADRATAQRPASYESRGGRITRVADGGNNR